jgi:hypothetical protein
MENFIKKDRIVAYWILRASFIDKNGVKHYARDYGKRAFRIPIYI